ncbi:hypothetical protein L596_009891 [Steinernema carpocapsae]|uniref:Uncharacterized protein n=1 Tax=Steinernema carpocapsae TaxID=34508 RepID=A0A4U5PGN0_STECR|nr:hypothetical protein L596_009891 [Steinernema carpocapsae]
MTASLYGDFYCGRCAPSVNLVHLCRIISLAAFGVFCVFSYVTYDSPKNNFFFLIGILAGCCIYSALFYTVFKSVNKPVIIMYILWEMFKIILIIVMVMTQLITLVSAKEPQLGLFVGLMFAFFAMAILKCFFVAVFIVLYKRIVIANQPADYHAQYFNGEVQINAFNNEMFPAPPSADFGPRSEHPFEAPPINYDPERLPTYEAVMVVNKEPTTES